MLDLHAAKGIKAAKVLAGKHRKKFSADLVAISPRIASQDAVIDIYSHNSECKVIFPNCENALVSKKLLKTFLTQALGQ
tara:strand:+ start:1324 stop:1560 length:237 start_codon:yes stop_codon:yes gene_type:complete